MPLSCGTSHKKIQVNQKKIRPPPLAPKVYVVNAVLAIWAIVSFFGFLALTPTFFKISDQKLVLRHPHSMGDKVVCNILA